MSSTALRDESTNMDQGGEGVVASSAATAAPSPAADEPELDMATFEEKEDEDDPHLSTVEIRRPGLARHRTSILLAPSEVESAVVDNAPTAKDLLQRAKEETLDAAQNAAWESKLDALQGSVYIGHTNTDMDSIGSALACAELYGGIATRATEHLNNEIRTCLKHWGLEQPTMFRDLRHKGANCRVCLVDHQQTTQFAEGVLEKNVVGVIDHHSLKSQTVCTAGPVYIDIRPWGSACTIIACEFFQAKRTPSKGVAGMLLSGILSDTLNLKGPTTTESDRVMVAALAQVAQVEDINELASMQFKAKSAELGMMTDTEIVLGDHKVFTFSPDDGESFTVGFGVCECVTEAFDDLLKRADGLRVEVQQVKAEKGLMYSFFALVDIVELRSKLIVCGPAEGVVAVEAYGGTVVDGVLDLGSRVSRKNDFIKNGINKVLANPSFELPPLALQISREQSSAPPSPLSVDSDLGCCGRVTREIHMKTAGNVIRAAIKLAKGCRRHAHRHNGNCSHDHKSGEESAGYAGSSRKSTRMVVTMAMAAAAAAAGIFFSRKRNKT